jgi:hypothetical protein
MPAVALGAVGRAADIDADVSLSQPANANAPIATPITNIREHPTKAFIAHNYPAKLNDRPVLPSTR